MGKHIQIEFDFGGNAAATPAPAPVLIAKSATLLADAPLEIIQEEAPPPPEIIKKRGRPAIKKIEPKSNYREVPEDEILFKKQYYTIGQVSDMFQENISLIRHWENEFDILQPKKNGKGDRLFRPEDVKNLQHIYHLIRHRRFTIEGAKEYLKQTKNREEKFALIQSLEKNKIVLNRIESADLIPHFQSFA